MGRKPCGELSAPPLRNCILCDSVPDGILYRSNAKKSSYFVTRAPFHSHTELVRCPACGLVYSSQTGLPGKEYYKKMKDETYLREEKYRVRAFAEFWKTIERLNAVPGRILDVGAGAGFLLYQARMKGWKAEGVEPSEWARGIIAGREPEIRMYEDMFQIKSERVYDVISIMDVIEHMENPLVCMKKIRALIKDSGYLYLTTPNIMSLPARLLGKHWWSMIPAHIYYFSPRTLTSLLKQSGFSVIRIEISCVRGLPLDSWLDRILRFAGLSFELPEIDLPVTVNLRDQMGIYARPI